MIVPVILTVLSIGGFNYDVISDCSMARMGEVNFPVDDEYQHRQFVICDALGKDQTLQIVDHEVIHACLHQHYHHFKTSRELRDHLDNSSYKEEAIAVAVGVCIASSLANVEEQFSVNIHGYGLCDNSRADLKKNNSEPSKSSP